MKKTQKTLLAAFIIIFRFDDDDDVDGADADAREAEKRNERSAGSDDAATAAV